MLIPFFVFSQNEIEVENLNIIPGDINEDGIVNILDVIIAVNYIFGDEYSEIADLNDDLLINIVDIIEIVNIIIYGWTLPYPQNILFIGNSYTYFNGGIQNHLFSFIEETIPELDMYSSAIANGGATLQSHYLNTNTISTIESGHWDYIVLQEQSTRPIEETELFYQYAELIDEIIIDSGAETMFFMTWARENNPSMIEGLANAYNTIGQELNAKVCPVGRAWELAIDVDSSIELYSNDGSHPNAKGTYLSVCMFYSCLFGESPIGIEFINDNSISDESKDFLQLIAWETIQLYFNN